MQKVDYRYRNMTTGRPSFHLLFVPWSGYYHSYHSLIPFLRTNHSRHHRRTVLQPSTARVYHKRRHRFVHSHPDRNANSTRKYSHPTMEWSYSSRDHDSEGPLQSMGSSFEGASRKSHSYIPRRIHWFHLHIGPFSSDLPHRIRIL